MMTEYVTFLMSYKKEITRVLQSKYCGKNDAALSGRERMKDNSSWREAVQILMRLKENTPGHSRAGFIQAQITFTREYQSIET